MKDLILRTLKCVFGLFVFAMGSYLSIPANVGLSPWGAFSMGVSRATGISFGNVTVLTALAIVLLDIALKEKIGIGTLLDAVVIGKFVDLFLWLDLVPQITNYALGIAVMVLGQILISVGSYYYISPGIGCGPRDALMVAIGKRLPPKVPIGVARGIIEATALAVGWLLGAKVGLGTVIAVFGISFLIDMTFRLYKFDVRALVHEDLIASIRGLRKRPAAGSVQDRAA